MKKNLLLITSLFICTIFCTAICAQAPANDVCSGAIGVSNTCTTPVATSTVNATPSLPAPTCGGGDADDDIWYSFTAGATSITVAISNAVLQTAGNADIGMEVYSGPCVDLPSIFCGSDIASGNGEQTVNGLTAGVKYFIRFCTTGTAAGGTFDLCLKPLIVVPVKLLNYSAVCNIDNVFITWTTATEVDNYLFILEKSKDGLQFKPLAVVNASVSGVNKNSYSVTDVHPFENKTYYRLKRTDLDGKEEYFKILTAGCGNNNKIFGLYPNPVSDELLIEMNNDFEKGEIKIFSASGVLVKESGYSTQTGNIIPFNTKSLSAGIYFLQIINEKKEMKILKFVKQ
jgi:Secretion system C-terminal sorting domain